MPRRSLFFLGALLSMASVTRAQTPDELATAVRDRHKAVAAADATTWDRLMRTSLRW